MDAIVLVAGKPEPLVEIAAQATRLARLAWHLGNRHTDMQMVGDSLASAAITCSKKCCAGSARVHADRGAFDPERGAMRTATRPP